MLPLCLWAIVNWWHAGREVARFYIDSPVWDYLSTIDHYARYKAGDLRVFWVQHNEHRIVFPEAIIALDLLYFRGRILLPTLLSFALYVGIWFVMVWAFAKDRSVMSLPRYAAIFLAAILMAWTGCAASLGSPFLLQWTMNQFAAILSLVLLAKLSVSGRRFWLLLLALSGVICTYSSGNGLLLWPLLLCLAVSLRLAWRQISIIALAGALSTGLYFSGYKQLGTLNWRVVLTHPAYLTKFMAAYVSMPFAVLRAETDFGVRIGLISLVALALLLLRAWHARLLATPTGIVLFGYAAFILGSGLMIALGRMNPDDPLIEIAKAPRYLTLPLTYWGMLAIVSIWVLARTPFMGTILATGVAVGLSLLLFRMSHKPAFNSFSDSVATGYATQQWSALAVEAGILDPVPDLILHPDNRFVPRVIPLMRAEKLSLFSTPEPFWIGREVNAIFPGPLRRPASGGIIASQKLQTAVTVAGWTNERSTLFHHLELVFVDENNRIVGLGERLPAGLPKCFAKLTIPPDRQWSGFVNLTYGSHNVSSYIVTEDGHALIPMSGNFSIDAAQER